MVSKYIQQVICIIDIIYGSSEVFKICNKPQAGYEEVGYIQQKKFKTLNLIIYNLFMFSIT